MGASLSEKDTKDIDCFVAGWGYREEGQASSLPSILQGKITSFKKLRNNCVKTRMQIFWQTKLAKKHILKSTTMEM